MDPLEDAWRALDTITARLLALCDELQQVQRRLAAAGVRVRHESDVRTLADEEAPRGFPK